MSRKKLIVTAIILALVLLIGGILAYFTDVQTKTNTFKMGNVDIVVDEGDFPDEGQSNVMPGMEFVKSPKVINMGTTPVYAFVEVTIPFDTVNIETDAANAQKTERELFDLLKITNTETGATTKGTNAGWKSVNFEGSTETTTGSGIYVKRTPESATVTTRGTNTYVFAYVGTGTTLKALEGKANSEAEKGEETNTLFDKIRFIDVKENDPENSTIQNKPFDVVVSGYGIQTTELGLSGEDATNPAKVWPLVKK